MNGSSHRAVGSQQREWNKWKKGQGDSLSAWVDLQEADNETTTDVTITTSNSW